MNRVFVDTGGFYAALNRRDASHRDAVRLFRRAQREYWFLCTTNFVLAESHALILARMGRNRAWNFLQAILTGSTNVIRADEADERRARAIIEHYQDKEFSYCDAVSFAVMARLDIRKALAFDAHFRSSILSSACRILMSKQPRLKPVWRRAGRHHVGNAEWGMLPWDHHGSGEVHPAGGSPSCMRDHGRPHCREYSDDSR